MEVTDFVVMPFDVENSGDLRFQVLATGEGFPIDSYGLEARLGDEQLQLVSVSSDGSGFSGYLVLTPPDGARLFVTVPGFEEIDTGLVFPTPVA
jgi:hypothetical protein